MSETRIVTQTRMNQGLLILGQGMLHAHAPSPGGTVGRENRGCGCEGIVRPWQDRTGFVFRF